MSPVQTPWDLRIGVDGTSFPNRAQENDDFLAQNIPASAGIVTTLPTSPVDGMEIYFVADAANGVVWKFRYTASLTGLKWAFVGGGPLTSLGTNDNQTTASVTFATLTGGPSIVLPSLGTTGDYLITLCAQIVPATNDSATTAVKLGSAASADSEGIIVGVTPTVTQGNVTPSRTMRRNGIAAGATLLAQYKSGSGGTATFLRRELSVIPVRIG